MTRLTSSLEILILDMESKAGGILLWVSLWWIFVKKGSKDLMSTGISFYIRSMKILLWTHSGFSELEAEVIITYIIEKLQLCNRCMQGNSTIPQKGSEVQKIWNSPLLKRKEVDTNVVKNTTFHYKIDGNQSVYYMKTGSIHKCDLHREKTFLTSIP